MRIAEQVADLPTSATRQKTIEIKVFISFFCLIMEGSGSAQKMMDPDPGCPKTYRSGCTTLHNIIKKLDDVWQIPVLLLDNLK
jgi:hypothetical protein